MQSAVSLSPDSVVRALAALAHEQRLAVFRALVKVGPEGLSAGALAQELGAPPSSLAFHTRALLAAGLVSQRRDGRRLFYAADFNAMNALLAFLTENCCGGAPCGPAVVVCDQSIARTRAAAEREN